MADPVRNLGGPSWYQPIDGGEVIVEDNESEQADRRVMFALPLSQMPMPVPAMPPFQNVHNANDQVKAELLNEIRDTELKIQAIQMQLTDQQRLFNKLEQGSAIKADLFIFRLIKTGLNNIRLCWSDPKEVRNKVGNRVLQHTLMKKQEILADPNNHMLLNYQENLMGEVSIELQKNYQLLQQQKTMLLVQQAAFQRA